jgi:hypothetical protein
VVPARTRPRGWLILKIRTLPVLRDPLIYRLSAPWARKTVFSRIFSKKIMFYQKIMLSNFSARGAPRAVVNHLTVQHGSPACRKQHPDRVAPSCNPAAHSGIRFSTCRLRPSATNIFSFLRSVESHRSGRLPLKFAREVLCIDLWRPKWNSMHDFPDRCLSTGMGRSPPNPGSLLYVLT